MQQTCWMDDHSARVAAFGGPTAALLFAGASYGGGQWDQLDFGDR